MGVSTNRALGYRGEVQHQVLGGVLEAGGELSRLSESREVGASGYAAVPYSLRGAWMTHAGYVDFARASARGMSFETGVRASDSTLMQQHALVPWILGAWRFGQLDDQCICRGLAAICRPRRDDGLGRPADTAAGARHPLRCRHRAALSTRIRWQATCLTASSRTSCADRARSVASDDRHRATGSRLLPQRALRKREDLKFVVTPEQRVALSGWLSYTYAVMRQTT